MSAADIEVILYRLDAMAKDITEIRAEQKSVSMRVICPSPGACVVLQRDLERLASTATSSVSSIDDRVRTLENLWAEGRGIAMAAKAFWAFVGAGGLGIVFAAWSVLRKA
jgi:hypothetical protein